MSETDIHADDPAGTTYTFPESRLADAIHSIEKANRKLNRHNVPGQFVYTHATRERTKTLPSGTTATEKVVDFTLNSPVLCLSGWEFVATLIHEEGGVIARTVPGRSLDGWTPSHEKVCDHCRTSRYRRDTYVVRHVGTDDEPATGEVKQVGANCIEAFLGIKPTGLWMLGYEPIDESELNEERDGGGSYGDYRVPLREVIRHGLAASDMGKSFLSRAATEYSGRTATVDLVRRIMFERLKDKDRAELAGVLAAIPRVTDEQIDAVIEAGRSIEGDSDYAANMRVAMACTNIDFRTMGLAVSAIGVLTRNESQRAEREARAKARAEMASGFLADEGAKIVDVSVAITGVRFKDNYMGTGQDTIVTMVATETGHQLKWFASGVKDFEIGQQGTMTRATVKKHDRWQGIDETVVTRAKIDIEEMAAG